MGSRNVGTVKMEECQGCPMLHRDYSEARDKCYLEFAGPLDDCTRAGIAHKLDEENADLRRQVADARAENERLRASAYTPIVVLQNGAVVSMSEQGPDSIVLKVDEGWVLMALPHEETYIEIQVERE